MRVLLVSDLHYDLRKLDWVLARAGDPAARPRRRRRRRRPARHRRRRCRSTPRSPWCSSYLERLAARVPTLVCSGNHDLDHRTRVGREGHPLAGRGPRTTASHVDGDSFDLDGWRLTACAWWEGPETLAALEARLDAAAADRPEPVAVGVPRAARGPAVVDRAAPLRRPRAAPPARRPTAPTSCCAGTSTRRRSPTRAPGPSSAGRRGCSTPATSAATRPTFIELDLDADRAAWWSLGRRRPTDDVEPTTPRRRGAGAGRAAAQ